MTTRLLTAVSLFLLVAASGCTTGQSMSRLRPGMTRDQVVSKLGNPDGFERHGEYESLKYNHRLVTGWAWDRADYNVILKDGEVVEYGQGEVRVRDVQSNVLYIVPVK